MDIYKKLISIRKGVEYLQKTEKGNQGAMYVDPAVLVQKIRAKMDEANILLIPALINPTLDQISSPTSKNPANMGFLFRSTMTYTFIDADTDEKLEVPWYATGQHIQDPAMAGGSALTFFERYFLLKFFQIPTSKDDPEYFQAKTATEITDSQVKEIKDLLTKTGSDEKAFLKYAKADTIETILPGKFGLLKSLLLAKVKPDEKN